MLIWLIVFRYAFAVSWLAVLTTAVVCLGADAVMNDGWAWPLIGTAFAIAAVVTPGISVALVQLQCRP